MFHPFNDLPAELRVEVCNYAFHQPTTWAIDPDGLCHTTCQTMIFYGPEPSIMGMVCREWRAEMKKRFIPVPGPSGRVIGRRVNWLDPDQTVVYIGEWWRDLACFPSSAISMFRHVAVYWFNTWEGPSVSLDSHYLMLRRVGEESPQIRNIIVIREDEDDCEGVHICGKGNILSPVSELLEQKVAKLACLVSYSGPEITDNDELNRNFRETFLTYFREPRPKMHLLYPTYEVEDDPEVFWKHCWTW